jgi:hypothetical protein
MGQKQLIGIELDQKTEEFLSEVTEFNINARYEDFKMEFYKICTKEYTKKWIDQIKTYRQWIKLELLEL